MITCDTMDTAASIAQTIELADAGCEIVRITAPTVKDAANLQHIVKGLRARGCMVPIVADIHFKPEAAMEAAKWVDKVRINPGNYADSKKFKVIEYTDEQYAAELERSAPSDPVRLLHASQGERIEAPFLVVDDRGRHAGNAGLLAERLEIRVEDGNPAERGIDRRLLRGNTTGEERRDRAQDDKRLPHVSAPA